jgi:hypothetical protein
MNARISLRLIIYSLLLITFCVGVPTIHYSVALMIAILIKHKDNPQALFQPVNSTAISLPWQKT